MKFFAIFAALLAVACGQHTWTLDQLSTVLSDPNLDPALKPVFTDALNNWMEALFNGQQVESVTITIPAVDLSTWTLHELSNALENPETDPAMVPHLEVALNQMMESIMSGQVTPAAASVVMPAMDVTPWTLMELSVAIQDPTTNPALVPYLETALNNMMQTLWDGHQIEIVAVVTPAGLVEATPAVVAPAPVVVVDSEEATPVEIIDVTPVVVDTPVADVAEVAPVVVEPVQTPAPVAPSSPLVQIILNINQQ